jgi:RNA polymerase sigma-70 factor (ECF subfamily)
MDVTELLEHASWMRRLAMSLVRDSAAADDLVQDALVAAMKHPPREDAPPRPWLREVLRNTFFARLRSDARRQRREESTGERGAQVPSTDELVGAVEEQRLLAEEVLELDEPYRSTILMCFYEGLSAAEVAARLEVPAGTVRWRLKEALDRLRRRMDKKHGGDRRAWMLALAPLTNPHRVKGALAMKIALSMIVLGSATAGVVALHGEKAPPPPVTQTERPTLTAPARTTAKSFERSPRANAEKRAALVKKVQSSGRPGELDKQYVSEAIAAILPLFKECFEKGIERSPNLSGKIVVGFTIVADPTLGGLVSESQVIDEKSNIADPEVRECMQETIYAAQFPAPAAGGEVRVEYPFVLKAPDDSDEN